MIIQDPEPPAEAAVTKADNFAILKAVQEASSQGSTDEVSEADNEGSTTGNPDKPQLKRSRRIKKAKQY